MGLVALWGEQVAAHFWLRIGSLAPEPDFWCYRGMTLQARRTDGKHVLNSVLYTVLSVSAKEAMQRRRCAHGEAKNFALSLSKLGELMRMAHALVYYNVQGWTIRDHVILFNLDRQYLTMRHFAMGIERVDEPGGLRLATREQQLAFLGRALKRKRLALG